MTQQGNLTAVAIGGETGYEHKDHNALEPQAESLVLRGENLLMPVNDESCFNSSTIIYTSLNSSRLQGILLQLLSLSGPSKLAT